MVQVGDVLDIEWNGHRRRCNCLSVLGDKPDDVIVLAEQDSDYQIPLLSKEFEHYHKIGRIAFIQNDGADCDFSGLINLVCAADFDALTSAPKRHPHREGNIAEMLRVMVVKRLVAVTYDSVPGIGLTKKGARKVMSILRPQLRQRNLPEINLSAGSLRRIVKRGTKGNRPLHLFRDHRVAYGERTRAPKWSQSVLSLKEKLVTGFYEKGSRKTKRSAIVSFTKQFSKDLVKNGTLPHDSTLYRWIRQGLSIKRLRDRYNWDIVHAVAEATGTVTKAIAPLSIVEIDYVLSRVWLILLDREGDEICRFRPWIAWAIDVYSRKCLAVKVTHHKPSWKTVLELLRRVVLPNEEWQRRHPEAALADAVHEGGVPVAIRFDNEKIHVSNLFQFLLELFGIQLILTGIHQPTHKAVVESFMRVQHAMQASVPGAYTVRDKLLRKKRGDGAILVLKEFEEIVGDLAVEYNATPRGEEGWQPALRWREGLPKSNRKIFADINNFTRCLGIPCEVTVRISGFRIDGQHFHDSSISGFMSDLVKKLELRIDEDGKIRSAKVKALAFKYPWTGAFAGLWNPVRNCCLYVANTEERPTGVSFEGAREHKRWRKEKAIAYLPIASAYETLPDHVEELEAKLKNATKQCDRMKIVKKLLEIAPTREVYGGVDYVFEDAPEMPRGENDIPVRTALELQGSPPPIPKGTLIGGIAGARTAQKTRAEQRLEKQSQEPEHISDEQEAQPVVLPQLPCASDIEERWAREERRVLGTIR